jgi:DNA-binding CsgD family transcriptional regulator
MPTRNEALRALKKFVGGKAEYSDLAIETDPEKINACIQFMERVFPDFVVVVCVRDRVSYVSPNCLRVTSYDHRYFKSLSLEETLGLLHHDDIRGFTQCVEKMTSTMGDKPDAYKFVFNYRLKHSADGADIVIRDEKMAIVTAPGKFVFLTLLKDITNEVPFFSGPKLSILKRLQNEEFISINEFCPVAPKENLLSTRQTDIAQLIKRGFTNKAIATKLNLSINTVKNHKQAIFKKINVKNSLEMIAISASKQGPLI